MVKKFAVLIFIFCAILFFYPFVSNAGLIDCDLVGSGNSKPCNFCEAADLTARGIDFLLFTVLTPLAIIAFLVAGGYFLFGGANPNNHKTGNEILRKTIYGILIAYAGWIIINTILMQFIDEGSGIIWTPWNQRPECPPEGTPGAPIAPVIPTEQITPQCKNGQDDDGDGKTDYKADGTGDPDCANEDWPSENSGSPQTNSGETPKCEANGESIGITNIINCMSSPSLGYKKPEPNQRYGGSHTCKLNKTPPGISCHYGGPSTESGCNGTSHAVDYGKSQAPPGKKIFSTIKRDAESCGGIASCEDSQGDRSQGCGGDANHVHVIDSNNCGCN